MSNSPVLLGHFDQTSFSRLDVALSDQMSEAPQPGEWRGIDIGIYRTEASGEDENGRYAFTGELWVDPAAQRLERRISEMEWETLGRSSEVVEVLDRRDMSVGELSLSTVGMLLVLERPLVSEIPKATGEVVTTTSIPPLSQPLAADAVRIEHEELPTDDLQALVASTDLLWSIPAGEDVLYLASRPGRPPLLFGPSCRS